VTTPPGSSSQEDQTQERGIVPGDSRDIQYLLGRNGEEIPQRSATKISLILQKRAERNAIDDLDDLETLVESRKYVLINREGIVQKGKKHAKEGITNDDLDMNVSYEEQRQEYRQVYQDTIDKGLPRFGKQIVEISDEKEKQLRDILKNDREMIQSRTSEDLHARDLVLVRLLQMYYLNRLEEVDINVLFELQPFLDRYEKYILDFQSRNEVTWPDPKSFRA